MDEGWAGDRGIVMGWLREWMDSGQQDGRRVPDGHARMHAMPQESARLVQTRLETFDRRTMHGADDLIHRLSQQQALLEVSKLTGMVYHTETRCGSCRRRQTQNLR